MKTAKKNLFIRIKEFFIRFYIKNKPSTRQEFIRVSILAIAIPVFIYSAGQIGYKIYTYLYEDWRNNNIIDMKPTPSKNPFDVISEIPDDGWAPYQVVYSSDTRLNEGGRLPEYENLWKRNNDLVGWISVPGFNKKPINYPILYSGDNSYYVYRDYDKMSSYSGSIFLDGSNKPYYDDPTVLDYNYVIYGHAMKNKSMFGNLTDYWKNAESWENNTKIYIDFMNTRLEYEVFSTFVIDPRYNYRQTRFSSDEEYQKYLDDMLSKSAHDFGLEVRPSDRIITLSTCWQSTRRTAIIAKLTRQIIYVKGAVSPDAKITPIKLPTYIPLKEPSPTHRVTPTKGVTNAPSGAPTLTPTKIPTKGPTGTITPEVSPTIDPNLTPTISPTVDPSLSPTIAPTAEPTAEPTVEPTAEPTIDSGLSPTATPTPATELTA